LLQEENSKNIMQAIKQKIKKKQTITTKQKQPIHCLSIYLGRKENLSQSVVAYGDFQSRGLRGYS
jgi:hypothetical protein